MDVKKLITSFLILTAAAGSSALLLSVTSNAQPNNALITPAPQPTESAPPIVGQNAFAPQSNQETGSPVVITADGVATSTADDPNNLTDVVADSFMSSFADANADGLTTDVNGNPTLTSPDMGEVSSDLASSSAVTDFQAPDWDAEAAAQKIKISADSSQAADETYINSVNNIYNEYFSENGLADAIDANASDSADTANTGDITDTTAATNGALSELSNIETPDNLVALQESLIKLLVYEKNAAGLISMADTDPVRASLIYQAENDQYNATVQDLQNETQKIESANGVSAALGAPEPAEDENGLSLAIGKFLGVNVAHAQWVVTDPGLQLITVTNHQIDFAQKLWAQLQDVLLQILKNTLITFIQRRALQWVTGGAEPRFIQQWGVQLINTGIAAANNEINSWAQCVYPAFQGPVVSTLQFSFKTPVGGAAACPLPLLANALGGYSLQQFANNFNNGGWTAFGATLLPSGNIYGATFEGAQAAAASQQNAQTVQNTKSVAGQGFTGDQACSDGSNPTTGTHLVCRDPSTGAFANAYPATSCPIGEVGLQMPNQGLCANGSEPNVTTPAQVTNQGLSGALTSNIHQIVNANNIVGILVAMVNSLFNSLMQVAISSATGAINTGLNSAGVNSGAGTQTATLNGQANAASPAAQAVTCTPTQEQLSPLNTTSTQVTAYFGASGGAADANGNEPTYTWSAIGGGPTPAAGAGTEFAPTYNAAVAGTYNYQVQVTASTGGTATCQVQITVP